MTDIALVSKNMNRAIINHLTKQLSIIIVNWPTNEYRWHLEQQLFRPNVFSDTVYSEKALVSQQCASVTVSAMVFVFMVLGQGCARACVCLCVCAFVYAQLITCILDVYVYIYICFYVCISIRVCKTKNSHFQVINCAVERHHPQDRNGFLSARYLLQWLSAKQIEQSNVKDGRNLPTVHK